MSSIGTKAFYDCENLYVVINYSNLSISKGSYNHGYIAYYAQKLLNMNELSFYEDFLFKTSGDKHYLVGYTGNDTRVILPNNFNGENYHLGDFALYEKSIQSLTIGSGVLSIGNKILRIAPIKTFWLTNTPPIGYEQVSGTVDYVTNNQYTSWEDAKIYPYLGSVFEVDGVRYIPISPSERTCMAVDCAYDSTAAKINIGETTTFKSIKMTVSEVMPYAFYCNNYIKDVVISNKGNIGNKAFYNCDGMQTVNILNQGDIEDEAFYDCDGIQTVKISNQGDIGDKAFYDCDGIHSASISNQGNIGIKAFYSCDNMGTANISNRKNICDDAFRNCVNLKTAVIENRGILDKYAFYGCSSLEKIALGDSIEEFGDNVFGKCSSLKEVVVPNSVKRLGLFCFSGCTALKNVTLGAGITIIEQNTFEDCIALEEFVVPNNVGTIRSYAFEGCLALKKVSLGNGLREISTRTFQGCVGLETVEIGENVVELAESAFEGCIALKNINLGEKITAINSNAFLNCSSLFEITIPQATTKIGDNVFSGCINLANVVIADRSETLTLGSNGSSPLFADCPLDSVYIGGKITYGTSSDKGYSPFYRNTSLRTVVITDKEKEVYENEF